MDEPPLSGASHSTSAMLPSRNAAGIPTRSGAPWVRARPDGDHLPGCSSPPARFTALTWTSYQAPVSSPVITAPATPADNSPAVAVLSEATDQTPSTTRWR